jgi:hypothetical protein
MDVACFCGCSYSFEGDLGACPACGEYVTMRNVSEAEAREMRAELDLLLNAGADTAAVPADRRGSPFTKDATRTRKEHGRLGSRAEPDAGP